MNSPSSTPPPCFSGVFGVACRDIVPPLQINARNWGAAITDTASSRHRPLTLSVLTMQSEGHSPLVLVTMDLGWWRSHEEEDALSEAIRSAGIEAGNYIVALSHTHAGPIFSPSMAKSHGGEFIAPFLQKLCDLVREAITEALRNAVPGLLETSTGTCVLAENRDFPDPDSTRHLVGWNPAGCPDQTLLLGRVSDANGACLATIVNYACHPTILAWENTALSPDFVGAMREVVQTETKAPCLFLQGASGELAPRLQYVAETAVADRAGRCLGHAALELYNNMLRPGHELRYAGAVESGAPLARWVEHSRGALPKEIFVHRLPVSLPLKRDLLSLTQLNEQWKSCDDPAHKERLQRKRHVRMSVGEGSTYSVEHLVWKIGDIFFVAIPNEVYSEFQTSLREASGPHPIFVVTLANGGRGYLVPQEKYEDTLYTIEQSPYAKGSFEKCRDTLVQAINRVGE